MHPPAWLPLFFRAAMPFFFTFPTKKRSEADSLLKVTNR